MEIDEYLKIVRSYHSVAVPLAFKLLSKNFNLQREEEFYDTAYKEIPRLLRIINELLGALDDIEQAKSNEERLDYIDGARAWVFKYINED